LPSRIDREALHARMSSVDKPVLIEALGTGFYLDAHLPGAVNIPPTHVDALAPTLLPDLAAEIVVYGTITCTSSDAVAQRLEDLGYRSVSVYPGGKEDWAEHDLPLERLDPDAA
jgi:rhodanese-related sulfurtransferase